MFVVSNHTECNVLRVSSSEGRLRLPSRTFRNPKQERSPEDSATCRTSRRVVKQEKTACLRPASSCTD